MKQPHQKTLAAVWIVALVFNFLLLFLYYHGPEAKGLIGDESRCVGIAHEIALEDRQNGLPFGLWDTSTYW
jgi:hypothetical protein